jgi:hypothetical protein
MHAKPLGVSKLDQIIPVNKAVNKKVLFEKGLEEEEKPGSPDLGVCEDAGVTGTTDGVALVDVDDA